MNLKVSILIPCHNADRWIAQAIQSALDQSYLNKEVIVVDDGSTDRSLEVIKSFGDRIRWEARENRGSNVTRNHLLKLSTGEWLQYLDADDYLLPDKLEQQIQHLDRLPDADVLYSPTIFEYWKGETSTQELLAIPQPHDPWILLARWYLPQTNSPLWRKQAIVDVGGWKPDQPCCQEHELYLRLLMAGKQFEYLEYAGSVYRQWSEATICKRDKPEVFRQRLRIEDRLEDYLRTHQMLNTERRFAINQARFECARKIWSFEREWANSLISIIKESDPHFLPSGNAAPKAYQITYRFLGFVAAENIAMLNRSLKLRKG